MAKSKQSFKEYKTALDKQSKKRGSKKKKSKKKGGGFSDSLSTSSFGMGMYNVGFSDSSGSGGLGDGGGGGMGESLVLELMGAALPGTFSAVVNQNTQLSQNNEIPRKRRIRGGSRNRSNRPRSSIPGVTRYPSAEEDAEVTQQQPQQAPGGIGKGNKIDQARQLFQALINRPDMNRQAMIQQFQDQVGVTNSTAVSYYERLAKEAGMTNQDDAQDVGASVDMRAQMANAPVDELPANIDQELPDQVEFENPDRAGIIRTVKNAHLLYKRQTEDGSFEELWIYNVGKSVNDELEIRRDIVAGTDIPPKSTRSPDGKQHYTTTTAGNAQYLNVFGLPN